MATLVEEPSLVMADVGREPGELQQNGCQKEEEEKVEEPQPLKTESTSRRNKRKSRKPVALSQIRLVPLEEDDDMDIYNDNNKSVEFASLDENDNIADEPIPPVRSSEYNATISAYINSSRADDSNLILEESDDRIVLHDDTGALDLSVTKYEESQGFTMSGEELTEESLDVDIKADTNGADSSRCESDVSEMSTDAETFKTYKAETRPVKNKDSTELNHYAESTMHELLSMYGFMGEGPGKMAGVKGHRPSGGSSAEGKGFKSEGKNIDAASMAHSSPLLKDKAAIQMAKMASLQQGSLIGSPQVLYPNDPSAMLKLSLFGSLAQQQYPTNLNDSPGLTDPSDPADGRSKTALDKFTTSTEYIRACFSPGSSPKGATISTTGGKILLPDYTKYLKRFESHETCQNKHCQDLNYKEHYHCMDCNYRIFVKKEEMIRHFKWHKKRDESLQHGFMRYSPMDDCLPKFGPCTHNGKQTHYHCLQPGCNKVYISTSDVQMHANYHRKDSAIIQEGFQRFRATEDCGTPACAFYGQRTTHFHCRRNGCSFTFKNKADMEKHKAYHQKDEILGRDGFKKFMKYEHCTFNNCRYSKVANHIHCIRPGCNYVLHSTGQLYSHKRKHERRDFENAYRKFRQDKTAQNPAITVTSGSPLKVASTNQMQVAPSASSQAEYVDLEELSSISASGSVSNGKTDSSSVTDPVETPPEMSQQRPQQSTLAKLASKLHSHELNDSLNLPIPDGKEGTSGATTCKAEEPVPDSPGATSASSSPGDVAKSFAPKPAYVPAIMDKKERDESWKKYLTRYTANDPCHSRCELLYKDHYHCNIEGCTHLFRSKDGVREHAKFHEQQDRLTSLWYKTVSADEACTEPDCTESGTIHYHCQWTGCRTVVGAIDGVFSRLEHHRIHEFSRNLSSVRSPKTGIARPLADMRRRRGRPPKYPKDEIPIIPKIVMTTEEILVEAQRLRQVSPQDADILQNHGFKHYLPSEACQDMKCIYFSKDHFHCVRPRCHHATDRADVLNLHSRDFHNFINILENFEFFDRSVSCRRAHCQNNHNNRHFHCTRPRCDYSFVRYSTMHQHDKKHQQAEIERAQELAQAATVTTVGPQQPILLPKQDPSSKNIIKSSGTYFPVSTIPPVEGAITGTPAGTPVVGVIATPISNTPILMPVLGSGIQTLVGPASVITSPVGILGSAINSGTISSAGTITSPIALTAVNNLSTPGTPMSISSGLLPLLQVKGSPVPALRWPDLLKKMHCAINENCGRPFCKLKKKDHYHCFDCSQAFSDPERLKIHMSKHGVKLDGGQNVESGTLSNLPNSLLSQSGDQQDMVRQQDAGDDEDAEMMPEEEEDEDVQEDAEEDSAPGSSSLSLKPGTFTSLIHHHQQKVSLTPVKPSRPILPKEPMLLIDTAAASTKITPNGDVDCNGEDSSHDNQNTTDDLDSTNPLDDSDHMINPDLAGDNQLASASAARRSGRKRTATRHDDFIDSDAVITKQRRTSGFRPVKDEVVPEGFEKVPYHEDCGIERCSYKGGSTHFHCTRPDCGYGFVDRLRFVTHSQKHDRMDSILGDDFQQFRATLHCGRPDCEQAEKATHFHCLRCSYICTDANKVMAHRRQHNKMDKITAQGFKKYRGTADCGVVTCHYYKRQTHYHCIFPNCTAAVLGPSQMGIHQQKHAADLLPN